MFSDSILYLSSIFLMFGLLGYFYIKFFDSYENDKKINPDYLTGLKYLLNEESDKAINLFSNIIEIDDDTIQTHLALGVLFRRQGKIDKAIKLHENIINKPELEENYYYQTLNELGENYFAAGIYDKAEEIYLKLKEIKTHEVSSLEKLIKIYEYLSQWEEALLYLKELSTIDHENILISSTSHYYCQLTQSLIDENDFDKAEMYLKKASENNPKSIRQMYLSSVIAIKRNQLENAIVNYKRMIRNSNVGHFILLPYILETFNVANMDIIDKELEETLKEKPQIANQFAMLSVIFPEIKNKPIYESLKNKLTENILIKEIIDLKKNNSNDILTDELLENLKATIHNKTKNDYKYNCNQCGYETISHSWQCPTCKSWEKSEPINFLEKI